MRSTDVNSLQVASFVLLIWQPGQPADVTAAEHWGSPKGEREKRKKANVAQENMPALRGFQELDLFLGISLHITPTFMEADGRQFSSTHFC